MDEAAEAIMARQGDSELNVEQEYARLRKEGFSIVKSTYIICRAFSLSSFEGKRIGMVVETRWGHREAIDALHDEAYEAFNAADEASSDDNEVI